MKVGYIYEKRSKAVLFLTTVLIQKIMKLLTIFLCISIAFIKFSWCHASYVSIPIEDVEFVEMRGPKPQFRSTRTGLLHTMQEFTHEPTPEENRYERQAGGGHHGHVDYGAHTGHHGSFGWYAEFPVHKQS